MKKEMKRFQESNWLVKVWRYRWYIPIPFKYFWYMCIQSFVVRETAINKNKGYVEDTGEIYNPKGKNLWSLLIGMAQHKMRWYYTSEEVFGNIKKKYGK
jgi:hypothetical protein